MNEITSTDSTLIISKDIVPVAAYQAIYHNLTSKVEKVSEVFVDAYTIKIDIYMSNQGRQRQAQKVTRIENEKSNYFFSYYVYNSDIYSR